MDTPEYYAILGVKKDATQDDIKKAYRRLARKYHPDVSKQEDAGRKMSQLNEANDVLSDPQKRSVYDQIGHRAWMQGARSTDDVRPPPGWRGQGSTSQGNAEDFSEFFRDIFARGDRGQSGAGEQTRSGWPGQDIHADVSISLADAYKGTTRALQLQSAKIDAQGHLVPDLRTLEVKIPVGVSQGQMIRLKGQGEPGIGQGLPGDLYLRIKVEPQGRTQVVGRDLHMPLIVTPWEAALGADIPVTTPTGTVHVTVPAGSVARRKLRLRGQGIPGPKPGDIMLEIEIAMPSAVTPAQKSAWEGLAKAYPGFDPRPQ
ncbi:DnaJ C-terminal domain-containing protein [Orrella marina]|uniref:Molecular chaperone DnaJ n=1 Tax=Orrella marina TaxID=2163011 RepID=A0A2R4XMT0_9BURK|nr:DnaJ C-terminal domain-containing protein [Orrella marina]AWB35117.1 molecular chaperone DnaJ [Orrella marina]